MLAWIAFKPKGIHSRVHFKLSETISLKDRFCGIDLRVIVSFTYS